MRKDLIKYCSALFAISLLLFSCTPQKQVAAHKNELIGTDSLLVQHTESLKTLDQKRKQKENENQIDSAANSRIEKYIDKTGIEIQVLLKENAILIQNTKVSMDDWNKLRSALSKTRTAEQRIHQKIMFLEDLINHNMVVKIDQDVLFEPGKYTIAPAMAASVSNFFEPVAKEIDKFTQKYPDFPLSLVITAKGYADATTIGESSALYKDLAQGIRLNGKAVDATSLNKELSVRRALSVVQLFEKYTKGRSMSGGSVKNILYLHEGKGDNLPDAAINDYKIDDARRRIVLLFWSVFPEE
jgi:outer membrane protein OmpA-like peptidoglycan-associated protein